MYGWSMWTSSWICYKWVTRETWWTWDLAHNSSSLQILKMEGGRLEKLENLPLKTRLGPQKKFGWEDDEHDFLVLNFVALVGGEISCIQSTEFEAKSVRRERVSELWVSIFHRYENWGAHWSYNHYMVISSHPLYVLCVYIYNEPYIYTYRTII